MRVPPGNAVLGEHHAGILSQERRGLLGKSAEQVGLQGDENKILQSEAGGALGGAHPPADRVLAVNQGYPLVAHRLKMRAARDDRDVVPGRRELRSEMAANRARAEYADLHSES